MRFGDRHRTPFRLALGEFSEESFLLFRSARGVDRRAAEPRIRDRQVQAGVPPGQFFDLNTGQECALVDFLVAAFRSVAGELSCVAVLFGGCAEFWPMDVPGICLFLPVSSMYYLARSFFLINIKKCKCNFSSRESFANKENEDNPLSFCGFSWQVKAGFGMNVRLMQHVNIAKTIRSNTHDHLRPQI